MYLDTRSHDADDLRCDICIVGGGPAGIAMAHDLIGPGFAVVLLEAGGFEIDADSQAIYEGDVIGHDFPDQVQGFGGGGDGAHGFNLLFSRRSTCFSSGRRSALFRLSSMLSCSSSFNSSAR